MNPKNTITHGRKLLCFYFSEIDHNHPTGEVTSPPKNKKAAA